jgi:hypothetical protein
MALTGSMPSLPYRFPTPGTPRLYITPQMLGVAYSVIDRGEIVLPSNVGQALQGFCADRVMMQKVKDGLICSGASRLSPLLRNEQALVLHAKHESDTSKGRPNIPKHFYFV